MSYKFVKFSHVSGQQLSLSGFSGASYDGLGRCEWDIKTKSCSKPVFNVQPGVLASGVMTDGAIQRQLMFVLLQEFQQQDCK